MRAIGLFTIVCGFGKTVGLLVIGGISDLSVTLDEGLLAGIVYMGAGAVIGALSPAEKA